MSLTLVSLERVSLVQLNMHAKYESPTGTSYGSKAMGKVKF